MEQTVPRPRLRRSAVFSWAVVALICVISLADLVQTLRDPPADPGGLVVPRIFAWSLLPVVFAVLGGLVIARQPRNPVGWLLMLPPLAFTAGGGAYSSFPSASVAPTPTLPVLLQAWFDSWSWVLFIFPLPLLLLLFPTGRPPTPRWRWVTLYAGAVFAVFVFFVTFSQHLQPDDVTWSLQNPIGFIPDGLDAEAAFTVPFVVSLAVLVIACIAALFVRYRRAGATERLQIKWLLFAGALFVALYMPLLFGQLSQPESNWDLTGVADLVLALSAMLIPAAVAVAILRYRLWDIDIIINRALVYVPLTAIIAGIFSAVVSLTEKTFVALTGSDSPLATVFATVIVVAAFNPIKDRVQKTVDRHFKEAPDPAKRLKAFREQLRTRMCPVDAARLTQRFLEEAAAAFDAEGGVANLDFAGRPPGRLQLQFITGQWKGREALAASVVAAGAPVAHVSLAPRRRGRDYSDADRQVLSLAAEAVGQAIGEDEPALRQVERIKKTSEVAT